MADEYQEKARVEWDRRAREDSVRYTAAAESKEEYEERGKRDAAIIVDLLGEAGAKWERGLELGCGTGRLLKPLAPRFKKYYGADISAEMIERARAYAPDVEYLHIAGTRLPVDNLDVLICHSVFHHVPRATFRDYVAEVKRVLAPGGVFLFQLTKPYSLKRKFQAWFRSEPGPEEPWRSRYYTWGELRSMADGFRVVRERTDALNMIAVWAKA